jgi:shikimate dehydrogenase
MHHAAYEELDLKFRYVAVECPADEFASALHRLTSLGYRGVNATVPHKESAARWAQSVDAFVRRTGVANTIDLRAERAINTDAPGFLATLVKESMPNKKALVLGAGGTTRALLPALVEAGFDCTLWNRTRERAERLLSDLKLQVPVVSHPETTDCGLILNTTSAGLFAARLPIKWSPAEDGAIAYDVAYGRELVFLTEAQKHGFQIRDGLNLLVEQGALAFEFWLDQPAPRMAMKRAVLEDL